MRMEINARTAEFSFMRVGGVADLYLVIDDKKQLGQVEKLTEGRDIFLLGSGSNTVFGDYFDGTILRLSGEFCDIRAVGTGLICGSGVKLSEAIRVSGMLGLSGLECLVGIPGTVGGGVFGNCGAFGYEISKVVEWVEVYACGEFLKIKKEGCGFCYRGSNFPKGGVITRVKFRLLEKPKSEILEIKNAILKVRLETQPKGLPSCGSVYKRSGEIIPSRLIDEAGLKGFRIGGLEVSKVHAGFIVNVGGGVASDFVSLTQHIERVIFEKYQIAFEKEVRMVGILSKR